MLKRYKPALLRLKLVFQELAASTGVVIFIKPAGFLHLASNFRGCLFIGMLEFAVRSALQIPMQYASASDRTFRDGHAALLSAGDSGFPPEHGASLFAIKVPADRPTYFGHPYFGCQLRLPRLGYVVGLAGNGRGGFRLGRIIPQARQKPPQS